MKDWQKFDKVKKILVFLNLKIIYEKFISFSSSYINFYNLKTSDILIIRISDHPPKQNCGGYYFDQVLGDCYHNESDFNLHPKSETNLKNLKKKILAKII
jgi:hypothetical protein